MPVAAFKMGMLASAENAAAIAEVFATTPDVPLVLDPVFASGRGDEFAGDDMVRGDPRAARAAEHGGHAQHLGAAPPGRRRRASDADPRRMRPAPARHRLRVRAGHRHPRLDARSREHALPPRRRRCAPTPGSACPGSYHGSGCTLAAALAANLARGLEIGDAVYEAQDYTWQALAHAFRPGMGQLPSRPPFWAREAPTAPARQVRPARVPARALRDHARMRRHRALARAGARGASPAARRLVQYRARRRPPALAARAGARARRGCAARAACRSS